jgi:ribosomal protein S12 methylthiotransferase accessory factor
MTQIEKLQDTVSSRTGILKSLTLRPKSSDEPVLPHIYEGLLAHFDFRKADRIERASCGKGLTEEAAMLRAIGEAIERYCACHTAAPEMRRATLAAMGEEALAPSEFVLFSQSQYAAKTVNVWEWKPEDQILWARMSEVGKDGQVWVPAVFVYMTHPSDQLQDLLFTPNSSGFAAGPDAKSALRSALLELIERDAFMISWLSRQPGVKINTMGVGGIIADIVSTYERWGTSITVFSLPTDMPATVAMAVALDRTGTGPAAMVGLGCETSPREAVRKALFEICQMHEPLCRRHREGNAARLNSYSDVKTIDDHAAYFFRQDHLHELDFLLNNPVEVHIADLGDHSEENEGDVASAVAARGHRVFYRDLTTPDIEAYPIRVVRALVPQLQPISFGHGLERLGGRRLYERGSILEESLNRCPHPLA